MQDELSPNQGTNYTRLEDDHSINSNNPPSTIIVNFQAQQNHPTEINHGNDLIQIMNNYADSEVKKF